MAGTNDLDFDFAVIGSGFGGSVSACRLAEKGYRVAVIEMGKRWTAEDFPKTTWNLRHWLWRREHLRRASPSLREQEPGHQLRGQQPEPPFCPLQGPRPRLLRRAFQRRLRV